MKNLKKVLALVLVVATLMGLATVAGAAYTDANDIEYTEAVDVMSALGILDGFTDGSFKPTNSLTRAQAAKMVAYILNGGTDVNDLYSGANTFSDCTTNWAKGYIAYVNQTGIVAGVGGGKFNPNGTLKGVALAKMMLTSLGYDAEIEKYQNDSAWMVNVLNDAQDAGLLKGLESVNMYGDITREQASQMMFNALKATMVRYENKGTEFEINGVPVIIGASDTEAVPQGSYANNMGEGTKSDTSTQSLQLAEKYFGGTKGLKQSNAKADDFGRPAHEWMYDNKSIGFYADEAELTYTAAVELGDIYVDLGKYEDKNAERYIDSETAETAKVSVSAKSPTEVGGQGTLTLVYVGNFDNDDDTKDQVRIVEINTYTGTISKFTKATDSADAYITIKSTTSIGGLNTKFETDAFTKDDEDTRILFTQADGDIQSVVVAETVEGSVSKQSDSALTIDGTSYKIAAKADMDAVNFDDTFTFYLDANGNVIFAEVKEAGTQSYAYVTKVEETDSLSNGTGVLAEVYLTDGTKAVVNVATSNSKYDLPQSNGAIKADEAVGGASVSDMKYTVGNWFAYSVNSDKEYTFKALNSKYAAVHDATSSDLVMTKDKATSVAGKYTTADTVVSVYNTDDEFSTATGLIEATLDGKILVTYNKDAKAAKAIYAVGQANSLTTADVTYAYALETDGKTSDGAVWKFAMDGKTVSYTVKGEDLDSPKIDAGKIYTLNLSDDVVTSYSAKTTKTGEVEYADANTVAIKGDKAYTTADNFAVYNVDDDLADADVGMTDTLEEGDTVAYVVDGSKIAVAFIIAEAE